MRGRECNRGKRDPERIYWRKESKGEEGMAHTSASWELFLISQAESHALNPENTHSDHFLLCSQLCPIAPPPTSSHSSFLVLFTFTTFYSQLLSWVYSLLFFCFPIYFFSVSFELLAPDIHWPAPSLNRSSLCPPISKAHHLILPKTPH